MSSCIAASLVCLDSPEEKWSRSSAVDRGTRKEFEAWERHVRFAELGLDPFQHLRHGQHRLVLRLCYLPGLLGFRLDDVGASSGVEEEVHVLPRCPIPLLVPQSLEHGRGRVRVSVPHEQKQETELAGPLVEVALEDARVILSPSEGGANMSERRELGRTRSGRWRDGKQRVHLRDSRAVGMPQEILEGRGVELEQVPAVEIGDGREGHLWRDGR
jgi:hypothetical protein